MWAWEQGEYTPSFMAKVLAWHSAHRLIELHGEDAVGEAMRRRMKRKG